MIKVSTLKKNKDNPREIRDEKFELLKRSITEFPEMMRLRPMVIDNDNVVLGGNMRLAALKALGMKEIPDDWVMLADDLTDEQKREFVIKDNNSFGQYDWDLLSAWDDLPLKDWGVDIPDYEAVDEVGEADAEPQIDKAAELNEKWGVVSGDLWQIGAHRLLCGSSTIRADVNNLMDGERASAVVTDSPYGIGKEGIENDEEEGLRELFDGMLEAMPIDNAVIINFQSPRLFPHWIDAVRTAGHHFERALWFYDKTDVTFPWRGWLMTSQIALVSSYGDAKWAEDVYHHDCYIVESAGKQDDSGGHTTAKPRDIVQELIQHTVGLVYEPFAGSGTTLVACQNLNRKCYAIEISPNYCAVILERMQTAFPDIEIKRIEQAEAVNG